jgi:hypothetical protein
MSHWSLWSGFLNADFDRRRKGVARLWRQKSGRQDQSDGVASAVGIASESKRVLHRTLGAAESAKAASFGVPNSVPKWRTRHDSNV